VDIHTFCLHQSGTPQTSTANKNTNRAGRLRHRRSGLSLIYANFKSCIEGPSFYSVLCLEQKAHDAIYKRYDSLSFSIRVEKSISTNVGYLITKRKTFIDFNIDYKSQFLKTACLVQWAMGQWSANLYS